MPKARPRVDIESVLVAHYRADPDDFTRDIIGLGDEARVGKNLATDFPQNGRQDLRITRIGGTDTDTDTAHLERTTIQLEAFGETSLEALDLWLKAEVSLRLCTDRIHTGAVVTLVEKLTGPVEAPDPETGAPRYYSSHSVYVHPVALS